MASLCVKTASLCFLTAQAIGTRLSELCHSDSESPANILGYIFDEETKRRMRKEDEEEDYLDDSEWMWFYKSIHFLFYSVVK